MDRGAGEHTNEQAELAGLYALGVLDGAELREFELHLAACPACQAILAEDRLTVARLSQAAPELEPRPGFKERLLLRAEAEVASEVPQRPANVTALRPSSRRSRAWLMPLAAMLVFALGLSGVIGQQLYAGQVLASTTLQATAGASSLGSAVVVVRRSGAAELQLRDLPAPAPGQVYEAWIIQGDSPPRPAGTQTSGSGTIPMQGPVLGNTVAITLEPEPGSTAPTSNPLLAGIVSA